jgi:hypothetical protein
MGYHNVPASTDLITSGTSPRAVAMTGQVGLHVSVTPEICCDAFCQTLAATPGSSVGHSGFDCLHDRTDQNAKTDAKMRGKLTVIEIVSL